MLTNIVRTRVFVQQNNTRRLAKRWMVYNEFISRILASACRHSRHLFVSQSTVYGCRALYQWFRKRLWRPAPTYYALFSIAIMADVLPRPHQTVTMPHPGIRCRP